MKKPYKLGVIGCGFMASAILRGAVLSDFLKGKKIIVSDTDLSKVEKMGEELGITACDSNRYVAENSEYLLFAIKPQNFPEVAAEISDVSPDKVISIMAGVRKDKIKNSLGVGLIKVARCMPNLPCTVGSGMMAVDMSDFNTDTEDTEFISNLFNCMGEVLSTEEAKLDAVTGISGSGPAYVFLFIDSLVEAGIENGLTADEAKFLAVQTVLGGAEMVINSDKPLPELIKNVCSKGGTTIEAIKVFEANNFRKIIFDAVAACVRRSKELSE